MLKRANIVISLLAICSVLFFFRNSSRSGQLIINPLFSDHMVLQQRQQVAVWGCSPPGDEVVVVGSWGEEARTTADIIGKWKTHIKTPLAGGPYSLKIISNDSTVTFNDVLIGEVWLASGQSNMQITLTQDGPIDNAEKEVTEAKYPQIRMFTVEKQFALKPLDTISGKWLVCSPENAGGFSATAYFFARRLYQKLNVPIGIISSSWGGTPAEAWTSRDQLSSLDGFNAVLQEMDTINLTKMLGASHSWYSQWESMKLPETKIQWDTITFKDQDISKIGFADSKWSATNLPDRFENIFKTEIDGAFWFRKTFFLESIESGYVLKVGAIDDLDATYINGVKVGGMVGQDSWNKTREYEIPKGLLNKGMNTIAIRAIDNGGRGEIKGPIILKSRSGKEADLEGEWKYRCVAEKYRHMFYLYGTSACDFSKRPETVPNLQNYPSTLYNAMLNPLVPYSIKGVIWYQGEANVGRDEQYEELFPAMIDDWRRQWGYEFPFYFVQIAPFLYEQDPAKQESMKLRNAQRCALKVPNTGMVVTLDIGDPKDIHPSNKQDVGLRLANLALANQYGKELLSSGPLYKKLQKNGNVLIVEFDYVGSGLVALNNDLPGFEIAGADKKYKQAEAEIVDNTVQVSHSSIANPQYVRYAWSDDFEASLFNKEGLPASTFTSED